MTKRDASQIYLIQIITQFMGMKFHHYALLCLGTKNENSYLRNKIVFMTIVKSE